MKLTGARAWAVEEGEELVSGHESARDSARIRGPSGSPQYGTG